MVISLLGSYVRPQNSVIIIVLCTIIISGAKRRKIFWLFKSSGRHFLLLFRPLGGGISGRFSRLSLASENREIHRAPSIR